MRCVGLLRVLFGLLVCFVLAVLWTEVQFGDCGGAFEGHKFVELKALWCKSSLYYITWECQYVVIDPTVSKELHYIYFRGWDAGEGSVYVSYFGWITIHNSSRFYLLQIESPNFALCELQFTFFWDRFQLLQIESSLTPLME